MHASCRERELKIAEIAERQHGVIAFRQLIAIGDSRIDLTVPGGGRPRRGLVPHETRILDCDRGIIDRIPVTSLPRTLLDVAESHPKRLGRAYDEADRRRLLNRPELRALCDRSPGRRGLKPLLALLDDETRYGPDTKRELEARFFDFCRDFGLPLPVTNVLVEGFLVDATWPGSKLIVELDSYDFHSHRKAFEGDRRRDAVLLLADYRVLRVTWRRLHEEPQMLASTIRARI